MSRREKVFGANGESRSGVRLTVTRNGVEVFGWYDSFIGLEPVSLTWRELEAARAEVNQRLSRVSRLPEESPKPEPGA